MRQEQHQEEQQGDDPGACLNFLDLAREGLNHNIRDQAEGDAEGNVVGEGHHCHRQEGRQRNGGIVPVKLLDAGDHQNAHIDQGGGCRTRRDQRCNGGEEHGNEEESGGGDGGKTGASALCNAGSGFDEGGNGGGAADRARSRGNRIAEHCLIHVGYLALFGQHIAACAGTVERAQRIEHIDHAEGQRGGGEHQNEVACAVCCDIGGEVKALRKDLAESLTKEILKRTDKINMQTRLHACGKAFDADKAENVIQCSAAENAPEDSATDIFL